MKPKPVAIYDVTDKERLANLFESSSECARWLGIKSCAITRAIERKSIVRGKYKIMYVSQNRG